MTMLAEKMFRGLVYDRLNNCETVRRTRKYVSEGSAHLAAEKLARKHYGGSDRYGVCTEWVE